MRKMKKVLSGATDGRFGYLLDGAIGGLWGSLGAVAFVLLFALVIKLFHMQTSVIPIVNQVVKLLLLLMAVWIAVRRHPRQGLLRGGIAGLSYILFCFVLFSLLGNEWCVSMALLWDVLVGTGCGAALGVLMVNLLSRKKR